MSNVASTELEHFNQLYDTNEHINISMRNMTIISQSLFIPLVFSMAMNIENGGYLNEHHFYVISSVGLIVLLLLWYVSEWRLKVIIRMNYAYDRIDEEKHNGHYHLDGHGKARELWRSCRNFGGFKNEDPLDGFFNTETKTSSRFAEYFKKTWKPSPQSFVFGIMIPGLFVSMWVFVICTVSKFFLHVMDLCGVSIILNPLRMSMLFGVISISLYFFYRTRSRGI